MKDLEEFLSEGKKWFERYIKTIQEYAIKLKESEGWLSTTLNSIGDAVIATDKLGNVRFMNPVAETLTGWKEEGAMGKPLEAFFNIINEETRKKVENPVSRVLREGIVVGLANHTVLIAKDGKEIPIDDSGAPIKDDKGDIIGVVLIFRDITERREAEKTIRERMKELNVFYMLSEFMEEPGITEKTLMQKIVDMIPKSMQYPEITCVRIKLRDLDFKTDNFQETKWVLKSIIKVMGELSGSFEIFYLKEKPDIDEGPFMKEERSLIDALTERLGKIFERLEAEKKIIHLSLVLRAIRNVNQLIIRVKDRKKLIQGVCDNLIATSGFFNAWIALIDESNKIFLTVEADLGESFLSIVEKLEKGEFTKCSQTAMAQSNVYVIEEPYLTCVDCPLSKEYEGRAAMIVRLKYGEKIFGWISVSTPKEIVKVEDEQKLFKEVADDIAYALYNIELEEERVKMEKKLKKSYNQSEFYKDLFTHDINNILQNIYSGIQLSEMHIGNPEKLEKLKEINRIIKEQVKRGAKLVSNIRKLSNLEEGEISIINLEISSILEKSIIYVKNSYYDRKITIQVDFSDKKLYIQANELLEDVFENIMINSVKYNENPTIEIIVKISKEQRENINYLKMEFMDNGIGIEDIRKKNIFLRGHSEDRSVHGMGLGLSLVKKIMESYDGQIWVEDRVKGDYTKGCNFIILIPEVP